MSKLVDFVMKHTDRNACTCGRCVIRGEDKPMTGHTIDMFFFDVCVKKPPNVDMFRKLITEHKGEHCDANLFDGQEHSYIELGGWIGSQEVALRFMGLGVLLGLWDVMHPVNMLQLERTDPLAQQLAGSGLVCVQVKKTV